MLSAREKIIRTIIQLQKTQPFFSYVLMKMSLKPMPESSSVRTCGVDISGNLYFDDDFVNGLSENELEGVLCHEVLHLVLLHPLRSKKYILELANISQDICVNMIVKKTKVDNGGYYYLSLPVNTIPVDTCMDSSILQFGSETAVIQDVSKKSWEEVYSELLRFVKDKGVSPSGCSSKGFDVHFDSDDKSVVEKQSLADEWKSTFAEAANIAKQQGKLPSGMDRLLDKILKPKISWREKLLKYLKPHLNPVDWTYQKPHKKSKVLGVFLPSVVKESLELDVVVDTSGSVSQKELSEFLSEIVAISLANQHCVMTVHFADTEIQSSYEVSNGDIKTILGMKAKGGGGTSMEFALDELKDKRVKSSAVVVFTDGFDSYNRKKSFYPFDVIWVITKNGRADMSYGDVLKLD